MQVFVLEDLQDANISGVYSSELAAITAAYNPQIVTGKQKLA